MNTKEMLNKIADEFEEDPGLWNQGCYARDDVGLSVDPTSDQAVSWCAAGVLRRELGVGVGDSWEPMFDVIKALTMQISLQNLEYLADWNDADDRSASDVVTLFRNTANEMEKS